MKNRIALFCFHRDLDVCENHLRLLRGLNPDVDVHGLFGGTDAESHAARRLVDSGGGSFLHLRDQDASWLWKNTDLAVRAWYVEHGHRIRFDIVHVIQWDLLLFDSLATLYPAIPSTGVALTGLIELSEVANRWWWTTTGTGSAELTELRAIVERRFGIDALTHACLGPGYALSREFLERYAATDVPQLCHDEIRLPLFAKVFAAPIVDTGFYRRWFDADEEQYFNADGNEIADSAIVGQLSARAGRRAFHPVRRSLDEAVFRAAGITA